MPLDGNLGRMLNRFAIAAVFVLVAAACTRTEGTQPPIDDQGYTEQMAQLAMPAKGCFKASFPKLEWQEVACVAPPNQPYPPKIGRRSPQTVGNGTDFAAEVPDLIGSATGSFARVTGVTSETGKVNGSPLAVANAYALQMNVKPFTTSLCSGHPGCLGWQQFIYSNVGYAFIQYWLETYNASCPSGWTNYPVPGSTVTDCWQNGPNAVSVATQPITNLASLRLSGTATSGGTDAVIMTTGGGSVNAANQDSILNLAAGWHGVEFVLVGDCCLSQANFNANATIVVNTVVHHGSTAAPTCVVEGFTGETNNLTLVGTPPLPTQSAPTIQSTQSNIAGSAASCSAASGIGDTHLRTFGGLLYDFQASGDFILAQTTDFVVQTRQVSGAPTWPNASINQALATQMGSTRVAICLAETPVVVDGKPTAVSDGGVLSLPSGVDVVRIGNVYLVSDQSGNSLRAVLNGGWIDASVGLGRWPTDVAGLLANPPGSLIDLVASDGTVFKTPISFEDLYQRYGESWRVAPADSLLSDCGPATEAGNPSRPFFAKDLDAPTRDRAQAICIKAGVKEGPLLDACTIDVAVLGEAAANAYVGATPPAAVGQ